MQGKVRCGVQIFEGTVTTSELAMPWGTLTYLRFHRNGRHNEGRHA
jgi:hypothetical protein